jgi:light-regulated signal transduction histidine kinase (bacteriophytochrome)
MLSDGKIINVNNTLLGWLDYQRDEVVSRKGFQDLLGMGGKIYFETHLMPLLQMQGNVSGINMVLRGKGEVQIPVLIHAKRVQRNPSDQAVYWVSITDITQRKLFEKELVKARKAAEENALRLKQINEELEQFAYTASHDLQAPLNTISAVADLILEKNLIREDSNGEELFSLIIRNTNRMKMMIRDLLDYSKIDVTSTPIGQVFLNEACNQAIEMLDDEIQHNHTVFHIGDLPMALGVKSQFVRLFQNLFSNAIKYRSEADPVITVSWQRTDKFYTIQVSDNGRGFEQEYARKVFEFMERLHSHESIPGTGIGLSACARILEKLGGKIWVKSAPGQGTTFYFTVQAVDNQKCT